MSNTIFIALFLLFSVVSSSMKLQQIPLLAGLALADPTPFNWTSIAPSSSLEFHPCYDNRFCARLSVPLDWKNASNPSRATIAMVKLPAVVSQDDPTFAGPLFAQPGGPGGSGVNFNLELGDQFRALLDVQGKRHYEIISFDPRGIANTEPRIDCFPGNPMARTAQALEKTANGAYLANLAALAYGISSAKALGSQCEKAVGSALPFVNTPSVARDMVEMVDKLHELRIKSSSSSSKRGELVKAANATNATDLPRLQYVGLSYGTVIGNYFASLFPGRVGRMVLDGVVNPVDYSTGSGYLTSTVDADKVMDAFFQGCFTAGPSACKLARSGDKSANDISSRVWSWIDSLDTNPIIASWGTAGDSLIFRSSDVRSSLAAGLYTPTAFFQTMAALLDAAMSGNNVPLGQQLLAVAGVSNTLPSQCGPAPVAYDEAGSAILCSDGDDVTDKDLHFWHGYVQQQSKISKVFGNMWSGIRMACAGWQGRSNWPFKGPFTSPSPSKDPSKPEDGRPAAGILYLSNRLDPVTPLRSAEAMVKSHPGAGLLIQESMGHTVLGSDGPNACNVPIVQEYLATGKLPAKGTTCPGLDPWKQNGNVTAANVVKRSQWLAL